MSNKIGCTPRPCEENTLVTRNGMSVFIMSIQEDCRVDCWWRKIDPETLGTPRANPRVPDWAPNWKPYVLAHAIVVDLVAVAEIAAVAGQAQESAPKLLEIHCHHHRCVRQLQYPFC